MWHILPELAFPKALKAEGVLGMNARNYEIISKNNVRKLYPLVDDKVQTKTLAQKVGIHTPKLFGVINYQFEVKNFRNLIKNHAQFVIKPAHGSGGKGVLVVTKWHDQSFETASNKTLSFTEVYQHISNILSGLYSLGGQYDTAIIEEMVHFSDAFKNFSYQGVPDVRIIVYKGYPAMAMMRLATKESAGRANLHQGAVGVGIDVQSGKTLQAVMHNCPIQMHPDTKADLKTLQVPFWCEHLIIGAQAFEMTGLGYLGADIVLDKTHGPMMLELNARPGLAIQIANGKGLIKILKEIDKSYPKGLTPEQRVDFVLSKS